MSGRTTGPAPLHIDGCAACKCGLTHQTSYEAFCHRLARRASFCRACFGETFFDILMIPTNKGVREAGQIHRAAGPVEAGNASHLRPGRRTHRYGYHD